MGSSTWVARSVSMKCGSSRTLPVMRLNPRLLAGRGRRLIIPRRRIRVNLRETTVRGPPRMNANEREFGGGLKIFCNIGVYYPVDSRLTRPIISP